MLILFFFVFFVQTFVLGTPSNPRYEILHSVNGGESFVQRGEISFSLETVTEQMKANSSRISDGLKDVAKLKNHRNLNSNSIQQLSHLCKNGGLYSLKILLEDNNYVFASIPPCQLLCAAHNSKGQINDVISLHFSEWANLFSIDYGVSKGSCQASSLSELPSSIEWQTQITLFFPLATKPLSPYLSKEAQERKAKESGQEEKSGGLFGSSWTTILIGVGVFMMIQNLLAIQAPPERGAQTGQAQGQTGNAQQPQVQGAQPNRQSPSNLPKDVKKKQ